MYTINILRRFQELIHLCYYIVIWWMMSYVRMTLYHGTKRENAENIVKHQYMKPSRGDRHWLGDGVYFFDHDFHAYHWVCMEYLKINKCSFINVNYQKVFDEYCILKAKIKVKKERIFDLDNPEFWITYKDICDEILKKYPKRDRKISDGVFINIMFEEMGFSEDYDIVKYTFQFPKHGYSGREYYTRIKSVPQTQICVKNPEVIKEIEYHNCLKAVEYHNMLIKLFPHIYIG